MFNFFKKLWDKITGREKLLKQLEEERKKREQLKEKFKERLKKEKEIRRKIIKKIKKEIKKRKQIEKRIRKMEQKIKEDMEKRQELEKEIKSYEKLLDALNEVIKSVKEAREEDKKFINELITEKRILEQENEELRKKIEELEKKIKEKIEEKKEKKISIKFDLNQLVDKLLNYNYFDFFLDDKREIIKKELIDLGVNEKVANEIVEKVKEYLDIIKFKLDSQSKKLKSYLLKDLLDRREIYRIVIKVLKKYARNKRKKKK